MKITTSEPSGLVKINDGEIILDIIYSMKIHTSNKGAENDYFVDVEEWENLKVKK